MQACLRGDLDGKGDIVVAAAGRGAVLEAAFGHAEHLTGAGSRPHLPC